MSWGAVVSFSVSSSRLTNFYRLILFVEEQCPKPDARIGPGRGDWDTPEFNFDSNLQRCIAPFTPALYPQCPPGWALEGLFKPYCYKKIYTPIIYDCDHAEGFKFRWVYRQHT